MGAFEQGNNAELCFKKITWGVCDEVGQEQSQVLPVQEVKNGASVYLQPAIAHECCHNVFRVFQSYTFRSENSDFHWAGSYIAQGSVNWYNN